MATTRNAQVAKPTGVLDPGPLLASEQTSFDLSHDLKWDDVCRRVLNGTGIELHKDDSARVMAFVCFVMMEIHWERMIEYAPQAVAGVLSEYREIARKVSQAEQERLRGEIIAWAVEAATRFQINVDKTEKPLRELVTQMNAAVSRMQTAGRWTQFQWALVGAAAMAGFLMFGILGLAVTRFHF